MALKRKNKIVPEFSLAAMIDVIFLLLMFFMLTSKFITPNELNLKLPTSSATSMASPNLAVSIKDSEYFLNREPMEREALLSAIQAKMTELNKPASEMTITVVAEMGTPVANVVYILDIANKLKVKTILATDPEEEGIR